MPARCSQMASSSANFPYELPRWNHPITQNGSRHRPPSRKADSASETCSSTPQKPSWLPAAAQLPCATASGLKKWHARSQRDSCWNPTSPQHPGERCMANGRRDTHPELLVQRVGCTHTLDSLMERATQSGRTSLELHQVSGAGAWLVGDHAVCQCAGERNRRHNVVAHFFHDAAQHRPDSDGLPPRRACRRLDLPPTLRHVSSHTMRHQSRVGSAHRACLSATCSTRCLERRPWVQTAGGPPRTTQSRTPAQLTPTPFPR